MIADRAWAVRNLGFDPVATPAPESTYANPDAAASDAGPEDLQREIIDFDSEAPEGREFLAFSTATGLSRFTDIPWPKGLAPRTGPKPKGGDAPLPRADVLMVTWTVDEGHALSRVLTPGKDSRNDYVPYTHNFASISRTMSRRSPAVEAKRLGAYWTTTIADKKVVVLKSDSHLSQDTKELPKNNTALPNFLFWKQIIEEVRPELVITTGTAGGIGAEWEVGDVIVSPIVRFDSQKWLARASFHDGHYEDKAPKLTLRAEAQRLFKANSGQLPRDNKRQPRIALSKELSQCVMTTDFFGFDTSDNHYHLKGLGWVSEMGDAVLGYVCTHMDNPPEWVAVRNVSDPQIKAEGSLVQQARMAAQIYKGFGRWSSVCSGIVCWSLVAAMASSNGRLRRPGARREELV